MNLKATTKWLMAWTIVFWLMPSPVFAYYMDSHYLLRFTLSLTTCFDWEESHLIASGDWGMDENASTHAEMNPVQKHNKINWHAFGHSDPRFVELWMRSTEEADLELRLIKLGQFMHYLEDWESHAGYGVRLGHARHTYWGRDPDSLGNSLAKNHRMVQSALDHLLTTCEDLGRLSSDPDQQLIEIMQGLYQDNLLQELYDNSEPRWKKGTMGSLRPKGEEVMRANQVRLEWFIETHVRKLPNKNIPDNFEPGTGNGIPDSLRIPFEQGGDIADTRTDLEVLHHTAATEKWPDILLSVDQARVVYRGHGANRKSGWRVQLTAVNIGGNASSEGSVEVVVVDSEDESVSAQASQPLSSLEPEESRTFEVTLFPKGRVESDVIIGAFARVQDLSASNDEDWLMLGDAEEEAPEIPITTDIDQQPDGPETIRILAPPKMFIVGSEACMVVTALVTGGDSTEKLDAGSIELVGGSLEGYSFEQSVPSRWSAITTESGLVGGKTFACFVPEMAALDVLRGMDLENQEAAITLEADRIEPFTELFPVRREFLESMLQLTPKPD